MPIKRLSVQLANQIAAGEVVERPSSVVKELVENAVDAKASSIVIEIKNAGKQLIKITDNGLGIAKDELPLALAPHATSKIACLEDLAAILTLGFRGEALASIASVSQLTLISNTQGQDHGYQVEVAGAEQQVAIAPAAHPIGTSVIVRELFFNTPARRRFLKSDKTEFNHIKELLVRLALVNFHIEFKFISDGKVVFHVPAHNKNQLKERILKLLGSEFNGDSWSLDNGDPIFIQAYRHYLASSPESTQTATITAPVTAGGVGLAACDNGAGAASAGAGAGVGAGAAVYQPFYRDHEEVEHNDPLGHKILSIYGILLKPQSFSKSSPDKLITFLNGRCISDRTVNHAIREAYLNAVQQELDFKPSIRGVLFMHCDPYSVDVNVHPRKDEVRFHNSNLIHDCIVANINAVMKLQHVTKENVVTGTLAIDYTKLADAPPHTTANAATSAATGAAASVATSGAGELAGTSLTAEHDAAITVGTASAAAAQGEGSASMAPSQPRWAHSASQLAGDESLVFSELTGPSYDPRAELQQDHITNYSGDYNYDYALHPKFNTLSELDFGLERQPSSSASTNSAIKEPVTSKLEDLEELDDAELSSTSPVLSIGQGSITGAGMTMYSAASSATNQAAHEGLVGSGLLSKSHDGLDAKAAQVTGLGSSNEGNQDVVRGFRADFTNKVFAYLERTKVTATSATAPAASGAASDGTGTNASAASAVGKGYQDGAPNGQHLSGRLCPVSALKDEAQEQQACRQAQEYVQDLKLINYVTGSSYQSWAQEPPSDAVQLTMLNGQPSTASRSSGAAQVPAQGSKSLDELLLEQENQRLKAKLAATAPATSGASAALTPSAVAAASALGEATATATAGDAGAAEAGLDSLAELGEVASLGAAQSALGEVSADHGVGYGTEHGAVEGSLQGAIAVPATMPALGPATAEAYRADAGGRSIAPFKHEQITGQYLSLVTADVVFVGCEQRFFMIKASELHYALLKQEFIRQLKEQSVPSYELGLPFSVRCEAEFIKACRHKEVVKAAQRCGFVIQSHLARGYVELKAIPQIIVKCNLAQVALAALRLICLSYQSINEDGTCPEQLANLLSRAKEISINSDFDAQQLVAKLEHASVLSTLVQEQHAQELNLLNMAASLLKLQPIYSCPRR